MLDLAQIRETIPLVQPCGSISRLASWLGKGFNLPLKYVSSEDSH